MEIKTVELEREALNWAVAKTQETPVMEAACPKGKAGFMVSLGGFVRTNYPEDWGQSGPILSRAKIGHRWVTEETCKSFCTLDGRTYEAVGPSPIISGLRCYLLSTLGELIDVPAAVAGLPLKQARSSNPGLGM